MTSPSACPNGAGKSTLLKAILGEVPHAGTLHYVDAKGKHTGHPVIGYVPQYLRFDVSAPTSVEDLFMACLSRRPVWLFPAGKLRARIRRGLARVRAEHLIDRRLGALSGGELQRVLLALALDPMPDLLLLDEPVSGVDQNGLELFYEIVAELREKEDMAIILISHDLNMVAKHADQVVLLNKRVICSGTPAEVFADRRTKHIFGVLAGETAPSNTPIAMPVKAPCPSESEKKAMRLATTIVLRRPKSGVTSRIARNAFCMK